MIQENRNPSMRTTGRTERAGIPKYHQTNHQKRPPSTPISDVPAASPRHESFHLDDLPIDVLSAIKRHYLWH